MAVLAAVADHVGTEPSKLDTPLYRAIDPDALDRLVAAGEDVRVTFTYAGHAITVRGDGTVDVDDHDEGGLVR